MLDDFNRANGSIGYDWGGVTQMFAINNQQLQPLQGGNAIYWDSLFGAEQEAYVTFSDVHWDADEVDLLLKLQEDNDGVIVVWYDPNNEVVSVCTYATGQGWVAHGSEIEVSFAYGDVLGAHADADGEVSVYKNGALLGVRDVSSTPPGAPRAWPYNENVGYIGMWLVGASTTWRLDDFGGGSLGEQGRSSGEKESTKPVEIDWPSVTEWRKNQPEPQPEPKEEPKVTPVELLREGWEAVVTFVAGLFQPDVVEASSGGVMPLDFSSMTLLEETAESVEITYTYDALGRLTAADYDTGTYFHYEYDAVGNRLEEAKKLDPLQQEVVTAYAYDDANRLTSVGGVSYTWDANGNLLSDGVKTYGYTNNKLSSIIGNNLNVTYQYNGLGERVSKTLNGVTTNYALDQAAGLTQVLSDGTNTYLYGNGRIGQFTAQDSEYYLTDVLGSVRQMVDGSGEITLTKSYEPYGKVISSLGNGSSAYGFTGEMQDTSTGMVYLRARYYASYLNQFIQPDPILHDPRVPADLNRYSYGRNNPLRYVDPSGMISCEDSNDPECVARATRLQSVAAEIKEKVRSGSLLPVEGLATLVSKAMELFDHDIRGMMWSTTVVLNGYDPNRDAVYKQAWDLDRYGGGLSPFFIEQDWLPYQNDPSKNDKSWEGTTREWIHSLRGDWRKDYWDKTANQAYHFWFYASVQFFDRGPWSFGGNIYHDKPYEWEDYDYNDTSPDKEKEAPPISGNSKPDFMLGLAGMNFGVRLTQEYELLNLLYPPDCRGEFVPVTAFDPGYWIQSHLK